MVVEKRISHGKYCAVLIKLARILDSIYELMFEMVIGRSNMHSHGMLNSGMPSTILGMLKFVLLADEIQHFNQL